MAIEIANAIRKAETARDDVKVANQEMFVRKLQAALSIFTTIDEWWLQLHDDECPIHEASEYHPDDCPPELECNCGGEARMRQICDA